MAVDWNEAQVSRLRELWSGGLGTTKIAERMTQEFHVTFTKSGIVGKAHRLNLPSRESPIKRMTDAQKMEAARQAAAKRERADAELRQRQAAARARAPGLPAPSAEPAAEPGPMPPAPLPVPMAPRAGSRTCMWPMGDPRSEGFRYCDDARWNGTRWPYCETHARLARAHARGGQAA